MASLGILLIIFGFGSLLLAEFGYEFRLLSWAEDMQPAFGIILGIVGIGVLVAAVLMNKRKQAAMTSGGTWSQPGQPGQPGQFGGPQTGAQPGQPAQFGGPQPGAPDAPPQGGSQPGAAAPPQAQQPPQFGQQAPEQRP